ncbi:MAG TPA: hypothetical protein VG188_00500 [Solirubrobacteraceae bacterium]|jgi:hypothetical protein|nr:hypothetical protein [Solirubrobacteraceae bacterium]
MSRRLAPSKPHPAPATKSSERTNVMPVAADACASACAMSASQLVPGVRIGGSLYVSIAQTSSRQGFHP